MNDEKRNKYSILAEKMGVITPIVISLYGELSDELLGESSLEIRQVSGGDTVHSKGQAKIIPINKKVKDQNLKSLDIESVEDSNKKISSKKEEELKTSDSTATFIIKEKDRLKASNEKLAEAEAHISYQKASEEIIIINDSNEDDEPLVVGHKGVLINKVQS